MTSRAALRRLCLALALLAPLPVLAGAQIYEPLADSVRATLSAAVSDRAPPTLNFRRPEDAHRWLFEMSRRLATRVPDRAVRLQLLKAVQYEATRAGLDPQLVLGVIDVESEFRKYAVSSSGARGYMQVMPFWTKLIGLPRDNLFHLRTNLRYGCVILRYYLDREKGNYFRALGRYNGTLGQAQYPSLVIRAWRRRWSYDAPTD
ncbi:MAG TPA: transglycosylase SLT domain-containing protein [Burkholderiales bacterium]|nr:transglycosylase SLT domain-containing protein [Burkholderiales bacterium]